MQSEAPHTSMFRIEKLFSNDTVIDQNDFDNKYNSVITNERYSINSLYRDPDCCNLVGDTDQLPATTTATIN